MSFSRASQIAAGDFGCREFLGSVLCVVAGGGFVPQGTTEPS